MSRSAIRAALRVIRQAARLSEAQQFGHKPTDDAVKAYVVYGGDLGVRIEQAKKNLAESKREDRAKRRRYRLSIKRDEEAERQKKLQAAHEETMAQRVQNKAKKMASRVGNIASRIVPKFT